MAKLEAWVALPCALRAGIAAYVKVDELANLKIGRRGLTFDCPTCWRGEHNVRHRDVLPELLALEFPERRNR